MPPMEIKRPSAVFLIVHAANAIYEFGLWLWGVNISLAADPPLRSGPARARLAGRLALRSLYGEIVRP